MMKVWGGGTCIYCVIKLIENDDNNDTIEDITRIITGYILYNHRIYIITVH